MISVDRLITHDTYLFFCLRIAKCFRGIKHTTLLWVPVVKIAVSATVRTFSVPREDSQPSLTLIG